MALVGLSFAQSSTPFWLMVTGLGFALLPALYVPALSVYAAELFPTPMRASASSGARAANRAASALALITLLPLLRTQGVLAIFAIITVTMLLSAILVVSFAPGGTAGAPVAQPSFCRYSAWINDVQRVSKMISFPLGTMPDPPSRRV